MFVNKKPALQSLSSIKDQPEQSRKPASRIGIDARFYGPKSKGLGRYNQKLIEYLEKIDGNNPNCQYFIFLKKDCFNLYNPKVPNFKKVLADFHWYGFSEQLLFPFFLNKFKLDLMHFPHFNVPILYRKKFIVTIHDLILFYYPTVKNTTLNKYFYFLKLWAYRKTIQSAVNRAKKIIAVSKYTTQDIIKNLNVSKEKIETIYEGVEQLQISSFVYRRTNFEFKKKEKKQKLEKLKSKLETKNWKLKTNHAIIFSQPYLLYDGNAYPHKNLEKLILSHQKLIKDQPGLCLVIVGGKDYFFDRLQKFAQDKKAKNVIFPGFIPDNKLNEVYENASLYVFPSLYEGFGLPPLEALAKGTPVVSSNKSCLPEILGNLVDYFDPEDISDIVRVIKKSLEKSKDQSFLLELQQKAQKHLKNFNWQKMAKEILEVYKEILIKN